MKYFLYVVVGLLCTAFKFEGYGQDSFPRSVILQLANQFEYDSLREVVSRQGDLKSVQLLSNYETIYTIKVKQRLGSEILIYTNDNANKKQGLHLTFFKKSVGENYPNLKRQLTYKNDLAEGKLNCLTHLGFLQCDRNLVSGKIEGEAFFFYGLNESDTSDVILYSNGKMNGKRVSFRKDGQKKFVSNYRNGKLDGIKTLYNYSENDLLIGTEQKKFKNGRILN